MSVDLGTPDVEQLGGLVTTLRDWQEDALPIQLHPGDLGWFWRFGTEAVAAALRTWSRDGELLAAGLLDGPDVLRLTVAPGLWRDEELAGRVVSDVSAPERGVLPAGTVSVETPDGTRVRSLLSDVGWTTGEAWTPLRRDLAGPVEDAGVRIEVVGPGQVSAFAAVHRSAWGTSRFTAEVWHAMAAGLPFADGRCLLAYDDHDVAVAGVTVWSAGPGRPGLLEPMGVHAEHRGRGFGRAVCLAAAAELRKLGASRAMVCTPSSLTPAVATYASAGFQPQPERVDLTRA